MFPFSTLLLRRLIKEERGAAVIIIAVAFTVLLGFVALAVDSGILYLEHTRLNGVADAAALAGAQELPDTAKAQTVAGDYAQLNGVDRNTLDISFSPDNKKITIAVSKTIGLYFAKMLGFNTSTVNARVAAKIAPIKEISGLIPLGINENLLPLSAGNEYMIKSGAQDGSPWRGIIEFPGQGHGGSQYRELTRNGFGETVRFGDLEGKVPGNKSGPTIQGIEDRIGACSDGCTWDNYQAGCPRVVLVPIYRDLNPNDGEGDNTLQITGFASVFLERVEGTGDESRVWGRYINNTVSGETDDSIENSYLNSVRLAE